MAGRGTTFTVSSIHCNGGKTFSIDAAAHSPLWLLKMEIEDRTGIPRTEQSLVLKTGADDGVLLEDDEGSLSGLGIRRGAELLLSVVSSASSTSPAAAAGSLAPAGTASDSPPRALSSPADGEVRGGPYHGLQPDTMA